MVTSVNPMPAVTTINAIFNQLIEEPVLTVNAPATIPVDIFTTALSCLEPTLLAKTVQIFVADN